MFIFNYEGLFVYQLSKRLKKKKNQCVIKLKMVFYHRYKINGLEVKERL